MGIYNDLMLHMSLTKFWTQNIFRPFQVKQKTWNNTRSSNRCDNNDFRLDIQWKMIHDWKHKTQID